MGGVEEPVNLCTCTHRGERGGAGSQLVVENNMMRGLYCQRAWLFTVGGEITNCILCFRTLSATLAQLFKKGFCKARDSW